MKEVKNLRSINAKVFEEGNQRKLIIKRKPIHYVENNEILDIDTTIVKKNGKFIADKLPFIFTLKQNKVGFDYKSKTKGDVSVELETNISPEPVVVDNRVVYDFGDYEIVFIIMANGVKSLRILKNQNAPKTFIWIVDYDENKISNALIGRDAKQRKLDLSLEVEEINKSKSRFIETWSGNVRIRDRETRVPKWGLDPIYPVTIDPTIIESVADTFQNGTENTTNASFSNSYLTFGEYNYEYQAAVRFMSVAIQQGATINSATLRTNVISYNGTDFGAGKLYGYDTDNSLQWYSSPYIIPSGIAKTTATTAISRPTSTGIKSFDVTSIVQEIVNRAGWSTGNNLSLLILDNDSYGYSTNLEDFADAGTDEPELEIDFTNPVGGSNAGSFLLFIE